MRQGDKTQTSFYFLKKLNEVKTSGLQLSFKIFRQPSIWYTTKTNCIKLQTTDPEICSILIFQRRVWEQFLHHIWCMIFQEKYFCYILLTDQMSLSDFLHFSRYWAIGVLQLYRSYLLVGISMATFKRIQTGMREFWVVEDFEGERIPEFAAAHNLVVSNSLFTKSKTHLVTYQHGENQSQTDQIMVKQQNIMLICDVNTIPNEECVSQHKVLVCDARIVKSEDWCKKFVPTSWSS